MKILHVADLHLRWFDWVAAHSKAFDLLVIAGDLLDVHSDNLDDQARHCRDWLLSLDRPTIVVSGNHDYYAKPPLVSFDALAEARWLRRLSGKGRILAVDGESAHLTHPPLKITTIGWAQKPNWSAGTDILVTHAPPCGINPACDRRNSHDCGDSSLWLALLNNPPPRLILTGHTHVPHQPWSRWPADNPRAPTTILVPGCDTSAAVPYRWELDLETNRATWYGDSELTIAF